MVKETAMDKGLPWWLRGQCRRPKFDHWVRKIPWRREWLPTPGFLPGEFQGQKIDRVFEYVHVQNMYYHGTAQMFKLCLYCLFPTLLSALNLSQCPQRD